MNTIRLVFGVYVAELAIDKNLFIGMWPHQYEDSKLTKVVIPIEHYGDADFFTQVRSMLIDDSIVIEWDDNPLVDTIRVKGIFALPHSGDDGVDEPNLSEITLTSGMKTEIREALGIDKTKPLLEQAFDYNSESCQPGEDQHSGGAKCDAGKNRIGLVMSGFHRALMAVGSLGTFGAEKYSEKGFLDVVGGEARYTDAMMRHWFAEQAGLVFDDSPGGTGEMHATCVAWNALARLEFILRDKESK